MSTSDRTHRILDIFYKNIHGERYSVIELSDYYGVSKKTISRDIGEVRNFLSEYREQLGNVTIVYDRISKKYYLDKDITVSIISEEENG